MKTFSEFLNEKNEVTIELILIVLSSVKSEKDAIKSWEKYKSKEFKGWKIVNKSKFSINDRQSGDKQITLTLSIPSAHLDKFDKYQDFLTDFVKKIDLIEGIEDELFGTSYGVVSSVEDYYISTKGQPEFIYNIVVYKDDFKKASALMKKEFKKDIFKEAKKEADEIPSDHMKKTAGEKDAYVYSITLPEDEADKIFDFMDDVLYDKNLSISIDKG